MVSLKLKLYALVFMFMILSFGLPNVVYSQVSSNGHIVSLWKFNEILPDGYREITPDSIGENHGVLIGAPDSPSLVDGKFGKALSFDGHNGVYVPLRFLVGFPPSPEPIYVPVSTTLDISKEIKIDAWINVQDFLDETYNNIVVKCSRYDESWENVTRIFGLAVKAGIPQNNHIIPEGALSGYVLTDSGGFNEIVTTEAVVPLNEWIHVSFVRNMVTGMHLYVNGVEQSVKTIYGSQNPEGNILNGTEVYFGHDAKITIDELQIIDLHPESSLHVTQFDIGPNLLTAVIAVAIIFALAWLLRRVIQMWVIRSRA